MRRIKLSITGVIVCLALSACEGGRTGLSQPASNAEVAAAKVINCPIAFSTTYAERNSVNGLDVMITWKNISGKDLKYVYMEVGFKNAVNDWVDSDISNKNSEIIKFTGPISDGENHWGGWDGKHPAVMYSPEAKTIHIKKVWVDYMDGTKSEVIDTSNLMSSFGEIGSKP